MSRKQESPPAGNRKRCTACGITCPSAIQLPTGRGVPHPVVGGTPIQFPTGGYPIQSPMGVPPIQPLMGVPHPVLDRVTPIWDWMGYPSPGRELDWGYPHLRLDRKTPWKRIGWGTPPRPPKGHLGPVEVEVLLGTDGLNPAINRRL